MEGAQKVERAAAVIQGHQRLRHPIMNLLPTTLDAALARAPVVLSAALAALAIHRATEQPVIAALLLLASLGAFVPPILARRRMRRLLLSGDAPRIADIWRSAVERTDDPGSTEAVVSALAFVAYGWVDEARRQLHRISSDPDAPEAEHRLFINTLIEAFDGDRQRAVEMARALESLPVPPASSSVKRQVILLRSAVAALARSFARQSRAGDVEILERMANSSPLVSWAMRYAAAVAALDQHQPRRAQMLLQGAPDWPPQSAFRSFHREIERKSQAELIVERSS